MTTTDGALFEAFLNQHDGEAWDRVVQELLPYTHEVDKNAVRIWFAFFPVDLARALMEAAGGENLADELQLLGRYRLASQMDTSHAFLYGHRYWMPVKKAIGEVAVLGGVQPTLNLASLIRNTAARVGQSQGIEDSLLVGITAVGFMTLQQTGLERFSRADAGTNPAPDLRNHFSRKPPDRVLRARRGSDGQGLLGFMKGADKTFTVRFDENQPGARFRLISGQELTTASASDDKHYICRDERLLGSEGPIPVQCRAAACGTCWVGVLAGAEKLADVDRIEGQRIKDFGYIDTEEPKPVIRLACRAQAFGSVSIVIPPWNGVFGKFLKGRKARALAHDGQSV